MLGHHKSALFLLLLVTAVVLDSVIGKSSKKAKRPNIIFILADDYGYNDIGYHGSEIKTPALDQLAADGVKLENYYVQPICTPTRSQLMSGRYQIRTGLQHNVIHTSQPYGLPLDSPTLADKLKEAGYATHMVGKWHLGFFKEAYTPWRRGFDSFYGLLTGNGDHFTHTHAYQGREKESNPQMTPESKAKAKDAVTARKLNGKNFLDLRDGPNPDWNQNGVYSTHLFTDRAISVLDQYNGSKPLFMYLAYQAVHLPLQVPKKYENMNRNIKSKNRRLYAGMVSAMDEGIRNLTQALKDKGMWDNTILVFSTDNGGQTASGNNYPLRGGKNTLWEGGVHGVGFVSGGALKRRGVVSRELIHVSDWFPTLVSLARGNLKGTKPLDGINQWKTINNGARSNRQVLLHNIDPLSKAKGQPLYKNTFDTSIRAAVRVGDMKLITGDAGEGAWVAPPGYDGPVSAGEPRHGEIKSDKHDQGLKSKPSGPKNVWLFNITADPTEHHDLSAKMPDTVRSLLDILNDFYKESVPVTYPDGDPRSNPALHGGVWSPWLDEVIL